MSVLLAALLMLAENAPIDRVVVDKSDRTLVLLSESQIVRTFRDIKLGSDPIGPKHVQGDGRTPEGNYLISDRNPASHYHLSLRISYPDARDVEQAAELGRPAGGDIFIHGQPNGSTVARLPNDWTDGCIALSDADMDEVWALVATGTPITIRP